MLATMNCLYSFLLDSGHEVLRLGVALLAPARLKKESHVFIHRTH
jgi:hypothetical protein